MSTPAIEAARKRRLVELCAKAELAGAEFIDAVAEVYRNEAWRETGHASFAAWAQARLDLSERQSYRYLAKMRALPELGAGTADESDPPAPNMAAPLPVAKVTAPVVFNWSKLATRTTKLVEGLPSPGSPIPPSAKATLEAARDALDRLLGAPLSQ